MKSPCRGCLNEFEDKNKHPECKVCTLPIEAVNAIGKCPSSSMALEVIKRDQMEEKTDARGQISEKTKICSMAKCPHGGKSQPIGDFDNQKKAKDGKASYCKTCRKRIQSEYWKRKNKAKSPELEIYPGKVETMEKDKIMEIIPETADILEQLLSGMDSLLKEINKIAEAEERTPVAQVRYFLKTDKRIVVEK